MEYSPHEEDSPQKTLLTNTEKYVTYIEDANSKVSVAQLKLEFKKFKKPFEFSAAFSLVLPGNGTAWESKKKTNSYSIISGRARTGYILSENQAGETRYFPFCLFASASIEFLLSNLEIERFE